MESDRAVFEKKYPSNRGRRLFHLSLVALLISLAAWLIYINLPQPEFEITELGSILSSPGETEAKVAEPKFEDFHVNVVYSPGYLIDLGGLEKLHPFDIRKYEKIHDQLIKDGLLSDEATIKPTPVTKDELLLIHTEQYLEKLNERATVAKYLEAGVLQFAPVSLNRVIDPFKRASGGTLVAARLALESGIGINVGGGYHHAKPDRGEGFCLFADVPIAIRKLQNENRIRRAVVIDVDVHQGNGTILCLDNDETTFTFSMHQGNIYPVPKEVGDLDVELESGTGDEGYMNVLLKHLDGLLDESDADICFIVGGCDPLDGDPLASLRMTTAGIVERDHVIVEACVKRNLPVVLTLSGGYSPDAWKSQYMSIKNLIETYGLANE